MTVQAIKQRFGIIGTSPLLDHAINTAQQVAATDLTVLITGESGTGKEVFPKIIHQLSARKHGPYIAVNCGAIPEGTIDSELFGHEKGSFTGAFDARKGYFEVMDGGTIFLDEVADLPSLTQVRLLRVLESGEFIKVGSSKVQKTNVRVVAATNVDIPMAIRNGKFREDLYYRLNTVPIHVPRLRDRKEDIYVLFRKFATDFAEKHRMPSLNLHPDAKRLLEDYSWPGNVRQLKNVTEQLSILEKEKEIGAEVLRRYLPSDSFDTKPILYTGEQKQDFNERDILYKFLFDMKRDLFDLKKLVLEMIRNPEMADRLNDDNIKLLNQIYSDNDVAVVGEEDNPVSIRYPGESGIQDHEEVAEESLSLQDKEKEMIERAIKKHKGRRKQAAQELGISERTLYRKINEYDIK